MMVIKISSCSGSVRSKIWTGKGDFDSLSKASTANPWSWAAELRPPFPAKTSINIARYPFGAGFNPCENLRPSPAESMARWLLGLGGGGGRTSRHG